MTGQTLNGTTRPHVPTWGPITPIHIGGIAEPEVTPEPALVAEPAIDLVAAAQAEAIRTRAAADAGAKTIAARAEADAVRAKAAAEAEKQEIANRRAVRKEAEDEEIHAKRVADLRAQRLAAEAAAKKAADEAETEAERDAARAQEQQRSETLWKWSARGIYFVGLVIAAPIQFIAFWDPARPFMVAAPALLEGLALALACGAAWAVAHRRDVAPYRVGIMLAAMIAAGVNLWHGMTEKSIGLNAGIIGALASMGGPIVLMAYEHGMAQKADGIPSWRERRAADKEKAAETAAREKAKADRKAAEEKAAADKEAQRAAAEAEQKRKDADRQAGHKQVWEAAEAFRSARGLPVVTEQIWGDAWYYVTGYKQVGMTAEIDELSRAAQARREAVAQGFGSQVESQNPTRPKRDPDAPDGRRFNGGTPPIRRAGDSAPQHPAARVAAAETARRSVTARTDSN